MTSFHLIHDTIDLDEFIHRHAPPATGRASGLRTRCAGWCQTDHTADKTTSTRTTRAAPMTPPAKRLCQQLRRDPAMAAT